MVRALALNDGTDTVVLIGSDLLQTLPNLLDNFARLREANLRELGALNLTSADLDRLVA